MCHKHRAILPSLARYPYVVEQRGRNGRLARHQDQLEEVAVEIIYRAALDMNTIGGQVPDLASPVSVSDLGGAAHPVALLSPSLNEWSHGVGARAAWLDGKHRDELE